MDKIFVQIASYRDPQLIPTIRDCLEKAGNPERLVFSIAWQHALEDEWDNLDEFKNNPRFRIVDIDYSKTRGTCWARNLLQKNYSNEKYTLLLDSHHRFTENWDQELISMYRQVKARGHEKPLLTSYLCSFNPENDPRAKTNVPQKMNFDRFTPEGVILFLPAAIHNYKELSAPVPARFFSAHFAFTTGRFVREVPHDPDYYFHGEEISIAVRAFTWGYDLFHPHKVLAWHEYARKGKKKHWDDDQTWNDRNQTSFLKNKKLFQMDGEVRDIDFGFFDFGAQRTLEDYERYAGISFKKRGVQKYTLDNHPPPNPPLFGQELENSWLTVFRHCIRIHRDNFNIKHDYDFCAVIFEDDTDRQMYRKDLSGQELKALLKADDEFITITRQFNTEKKPSKWVVWPHSSTKGWLNRIVGKL